MNWTLITILVGIDIILLGVLVMCVCNFDKLIRFWMKRMMVLIILLFPISTSFAAGTWNHRLVKTKADGSMLIEFTRQNTGEVCVVHFSRVIGDGSEQLNRKKFNLELRYSALNRWGLGEDSKEILITLIKAIRNNPNLTLAQCISWYDTNYPDALFKGDKLIDRAVNWLEDELGYVPTWAQFKTYIQNNIFEGVDEYVP